MKWRSDRTWNIFSRRDVSDIQCAVAADCPVPKFILSGDWAFSTQRQRGDPPLLGFDGRVACAISRLNGFYIFTSFMVGCPASRRAVPYAQ